MTLELRAAFEVPLGVLDHGGTDVTGAAALLAYEKMRPVRVRHLPFKTGDHQVPVAVAVPDVVADAEIHARMVTL